MPIVLALCFGVSLLCGCSCSSSSDPVSKRTAPPGTATDEWVPPPGFETCDQGRDRRCLHADADGDGVSVAEGDCDDEESNSSTDCTKLPELTLPRTCTGADCANADQDGDGLSPALGDCDDENALIYPGAPDPCGDGVDADCDGFDERCALVEEAGGGDGGRPSSVESDPERADRDGDGVTREDGDCDDQDPFVGPEAQELCGDRVDNDCDGAVDNDCSVGPGSSIAIVLGTDEPLTLHVVAELPNAQAGDVGSDVMFLVDQSTSFDDDIRTFKTSATSILDRLSETFADLRIGLARFRDAPCNPFGRDLEWAYELTLPLTEDLSLFPAVIDTLATAPGATTPEAALEGIAQVLTGRGHAVNGFGECDLVADIAPSTPGWQKGRIPLLIVSTDAPFNRPGDPAFPEYPYPTGVAEVIELAVGSGTRVFFMISGARDPEDQLIADATGGQVFELDANSDGIVQALGSVLEASLSDVEVRLVPQGVGAELIDSIEPELIPGVNLLVDDRVEFEITFRRVITRKSVDRVYEFDLVLEARGVESGRIPVSITIPGIDV